MHGTLPLAAIPNSPWITKMKAAEKLDVANSPRWMDVDAHF
jgi:hypothetical protein